MNRTIEKIIVFGVQWLVVACFQDAEAQPYLSPGYILTEVSNKFGFYAVPEPPEFVKRGRPDQASLDYVPLKLPPKDFHNETSRPDKRLEAEAPSIAELEVARAQSRGRAGATSSVRAAKGSKSPKAGTLLPPDPPAMKWNPWETE